MADDEKWVEPATALHGQVRKTDEDFAAILDGLHSGGVIDMHRHSVLPLIVNTVADLRPEHVAAAFPPMTAEQRSRVPPLVLHITVRDEVSLGMRRVEATLDESHFLKNSDPAWGGPGIGWGDPLANPLEDLKRMRDEVFARSVSPMRFTITKRMARMLARRTMSKRAYRRWRGRNR
jgi:hypothetical protein